MQYTPEQPRGPLSHIRVLDFTQLVQGPMATQILGDLGADVIKFEKPNGEWMRHWGILDSTTSGETDSFLAFNRNKKSVAVDLKDAAVRERILSLVPSADIVVENFRPGVMDKLGLGYAALRAANPGLIYASASGYGPTGPYSQRPGQDLLLQAMSGLMHLTGRDGDPPTPCGVGLSDLFSGLHLTIGILAALEHRRQTGQGQKVDVDLLACTVAAQQQELTVYLNHGEPLARPRRDIGHVGATGPFGVYATSDGHLALAMFPCPRLGEILGLAELSAFDTNARMFESRDRIHALLSEHFAQNSTAHWIELLLQHDVWCAPVQNYAEVAEDPQIRHRQLIWTVPVGQAGTTFKTVGSPIQFSETPASLHRPVPAVGEHTHEFFPGQREPEHE